ncbi:MAG: D-2-hydroxyacid dehydrogenase [Gemmatimonadetes bacterium]|nr:D-2-hydroxyacid dehydrogenase [Gemmatimonadota bacterium]
MTLADAGDPTEPRTDLEVNRMRRAVLDMADNRPAWAMPAWVPKELEAALPAGWELVVIGEETSGAGDGAARVHPLVVEAVRDAEIYFGYGIPAELLAAGPELRWVHSGAAGVAKSLTPEMLASPVVFTNSAKVHAPPISETVLAMILFFGRGLDFAVEGMRRGEWWVAPFYAADTPMRELAGSTVGLVGYGGIGREVARRVASLGARVIALRRRQSAAADALLEPVQGGGSLAAHLEVVYGAEGLGSLLDRSDVVVVTAPETPETRGLLGARELARMKRGALLVNVARGRIVDEAALVSALTAGKLRGAGLDVFGREPLPGDDPFWRLPNVLITPHVSGVTAGFWRRETDLIVRNLRRYLAESPAAEWENVVDKHAGY